MKSGVYKISNSITGKSYIGSSEYLKRRLADHKRLLKNNKHSCIHLQRAYNKDGIGAFVFSIIEYCVVHELVIREQYWVDITPKELRYNIRILVDSNRGFKYSEEAKLRLKENARPNGSEKRKGVSVIHSGSIKSGERRGIETEFKIGQITWNKGIRGVNSHSYGNQYTKGVSSWNKGLKGWNKGLLTGVQPKQFSIVSPDLILYEGVGVKKFAKEMGLSSLLCALVNGKLRKYKGWRLPQPNDKYNGIGLFPDLRTAVQS